MAWNYARYIGRVVEAGKAELPIPMFVNAALYGIGRGTQQPASGGRPWDLVMDIWKAGAPRLDMLSPDNYGNFVEFCAKYARPDNPLFIPEALNQAVGAGRVLYAVGRHDAIGFSAMGAVERSNTPDTDLIGSYDLIEQLAPLISQHQGDGTMSAVLLGANDAPQKVQVGNYSLECSFLKPRALPGSPQPQPPFPNAAAIFIAAGPDEFYAAGNGVTATFTPTTPGPPQAGLATVEEGVFVDGRWVPGRRLAGDDTSTPALVLPRLRLVADQPALFGPSFKGILRFTLYRYR
jgi:hypothetical protein